MTAQKLDGKATAAAIKSELAETVAVLRDKGVVPGLGTVLVGDDPASHQYVAGKHRDCAQVGIESTYREMSRRRILLRRFVGSTPIRAAPGTSSSCRCLATLTPTGP